MLRVRIPPEPFPSRSKCPRGAARSARHPVKVETMGSNPIGGAECMRKFGTIRKRAKRPSSNLGDLWVRLPLVPVWHQSLGWCSSRRPVKPLPSKCEAAGARFDSFATQFLSGSVVYWLGHHPLKVEKGVRIPSGLFFSKRPGV